MGLDIPGMYRMKDVLSKPEYPANSAGRSDALRQNPSITLNCTVRRLNLVNYVRSTITKLCTRKIK